MFLGWKINFWSSWNELSVSYIRPTTISNNDGFRRTSIYRHIIVLVFKHPVALMYLFVYKARKSYTWDGDVSTQRNTSLYWPRKRACWPLSRLWPLLRDIKIALDESYWNAFLQPSVYRWQTLHSALHSWIPLVVFQLVISTMKHCLVFRTDSV